MKLTKAKGLVDHSEMIEATIDGQVVTLCTGFQKMDLLLQGYVFLGQSPEFRHLRAVVQLNKTYGPDHRMELNGFIHSQPLANLIVKVLAESEDFGGSPMDFEHVVPGGELRVGNQWARCRGVLPVVFTPPLFHRMPPSTW